jgi:hypothetical protein
MSVGSPPGAGPPRASGMTGESYAASTGGRNNKNFHFCFKECTGSSSVQALDFDSDG